VGLSSVGAPESGEQRVFCAPGEGEMQASGLMREERRKPAAAADRCRRFLAGSSTTLHVNAEDGGQSVSCRR
jgi:hypothetical protein